MNGNLDWMPYLGQVFTGDDIPHVNLKSPANIRSGSSISHTHDDCAYQWWSGLDNPGDVFIVSEEIVNVALIDRHYRRPSIIDEAKFKGQTLACRLIMSFHRNKHLQIMLENEMMVGGT